MASAITQWAARCGVRLAWDGGEADVVALGAIDADLAGADLVFLGEANHFIHEKSDFRLLLARRLMALGVTTFAEELGWSDGRRLQRWFDDGDPAVFDTLSLFGDTRGLRSDRDDRPTGVFAASFDTYPRALMRAEQERFYRGLRKAAAGRPLGYFCFDIDALPGAGYADLEALLAPWRGRAGVDAFLAALARRAGEGAHEEAQRLARLLPLPRAVAPDLPPATAAEVEAALGALADSLAYVAMTYPAKDYEALRPGMALREDAMKRRFADLRRISGGAPTAVMAHAFHLAKDDGLFAGSVGVGPGGGLTSSIGHHLAQDLGLRAYSVWLLYGGGEDSQPMPDLPRTAVYPPESLNTQLGELGAPLLLRLADAPEGLFDAPVGVGHMYNAVTPITLAGQVDAIVFLPAVTPMRA